MKQFSLIRSYINSDHWFLVLTTRQASVNDALTFFHSSFSGIPMKTEFTTKTFRYLVVEE
jgi:hypothetical protein